MTEKPAARMSDFHMCPMSSGTVPHVGGAIMTGSGTVFIDGLLAGRVDDICMCTGAVDYVANGSLSVFIDSKPAARFTDTCFHGGFVAVGSGTVFIGGPTSNFWTIPSLLAVLCPKDKALVKRIQRGDAAIQNFRRLYYKDPYYDGTKWTERHFEAGGSSGNGVITIVSGGSNEDTATTLFHEMDHHDQPSGMKMREAEYEAYEKTEEWTIKRGLPSQQDPQKYNFRKKDANGKTVVNKAEIKRFVDNEYPESTSPSSTPSTPPDVVVGKTPSGDTILERHDGSQYSRPPKKR